MLFETVLARIVQPDQGDSIKLKSTPGSFAPPSLQKAKSVIDENASEVIIGQALDVVFKEIERYNSLIGSFQGIDWTTYVNRRNKQRSSGDEPGEI
jgi:hypothetical protein